VKRIPLALVILLFVTLACETIAPVAQTPQPSIFDSDQTAFGFFPTPPEVSLLSVLSILKAIGEHGDVILIQEPLPWAEFMQSADGESKKIEDMRNLVTLAAQSGLELIIFVDPLQGLNRSEFVPLPPELAGGNFGTPGIRQAFKNYALRIVREFHPRYLGLASEINTYADNHPDDFPNYLSLYQETYAAIKAEAPDTQVFVSFQWEDLNNLGAFSDGSGAYIKWEQIEAFEPELDVWVISTYPFVGFTSAADIPADYYTPLITRTSKPLAVAEGGFNSQDVSILKGTPQDQVDYLNAINDQIGDRLAFWIYLILDDFNMDSYGRMLAKQGLGDSVETLRLFSALGLRTLDGTPKPGLATWDAIRAERHSTPRGRAA
jgi:hypothetical protein